VNCWMLVVVSIREKFSILAILPRSDDCSALNGSDVCESSSGNWSEIFVANSGMYTSAMHPIVANHRSSWRLNIF